MKLLFAFLPLIFVVACENNAPQTNSQPAYYDVAGYVKGQIEALIKEKPVVSKNARIGAQINQQVTQNIDWIKELELFTQADINKPAFRTSYSVVRPDSLTYQYALKPGEERLTVRSLTVRLDRETRKPARIEALLKTENPLYVSERRLVLESGANNRTGWGIRQYRVEGFQQLTYFDRNEFRVEGRVQ